MLLASVSLRDWNTYRGAEDEVILTGAILEGECGGKTSRDLEGFRQSS